MSDTQTIDETVDDFDEVRKKGQELMGYEIEVAPNVAVDLATPESVKTAEVGKLEDNVGSLARTQQEVEILNKEISGYMQQFGEPLKQQVPVQKTRQVIKLEEPGLSNLYGLVWWVRARKESSETEKYTDMETRIIKREDYNMGDVRDLLQVGIKKLDTFVTELGQYMKNIDGTVQRMLKVGNGYTKDVVTANQNYMKAQEKVEEFVETLESYRAKIATLRGTDDAKWQLQNEVDALEVKLEEARSDERIYSETSELKENYQSVLKTFRTILNDTKEEVRRWVNFTQIVTQGIGDVSDVNRSVHESCVCISEVCGTLSEQIGHLEFLTNITGKSYGIVLNGPSRSTAAPVNLQNARQQIADKSKQAEIYRQNAKESMAKRIEPQAYLT